MYSRRVINAPKVKTMGFLFWSLTYPTPNTATGLPANILKSTISSTRLVFSGEVDRLLGKAVAKAEDNQLPRLGLQENTSDIVNCADIPLHMELANESTLEIGTVEANFEIRS